MANNNLPPQPIPAKAWCHICKKYADPGHICVLGWTRTLTGILNRFGVYLCQRCGRYVGDNHLCDYQVQSRMNFATSALAVAAMVGIVYLPIIMRAPVAVVGSGPVTATPTAIIIGPPLLDMPTATPEPPPTQQAVR